MRDGDLESSLLKILGDTGGKDLLQEAAEFSLDTVLKDGAVRDIPVIGTVAKLYGMAVGVQGYVFAKKIRRFLIEAGTIPAKEREEFSDKLKTDNKLQERLSEVLITFLDKMDDIQKAPLLSRAFGGYVRNEYDLATFQRLATAIDRCLVIDLPLLEKLNTPIGLDGYVGDMLVSAGLASVAAIPAIRASEAKTTYALSHLGELFLQVVVKGLPRDE